MKLAKDEKILKSWTYAGTEESGATLAVTNKRVINVVKKGNAVTHNQAALSAIKGVSCEQAVPAKGLTIVLIVLGAIFSFFSLASFVAAADSAPEELAMGLGVGFSSLVIGVILLIWGIVRLISCRFNVVLTVAGVENVVATGAFGAFGRSARQKGLIFLKVNAKTAREITEELGAIICETQA